MAAEPPNKVELNEKGDLVVLLPIRDDEVVVCPTCISRKYKGKTKVESLGRHVKQHHAGVFLTYKCWRCGFTAPSDKRYPRKVVQQHCGDCVPAVRSVPTGRTDTNRRNNIRQDLLPDRPVNRDIGTRQRHTRRHVVVSEDQDNNLSDVPPENVDRALSFVQDVVLEIVPGNPSPSPNVGDPVGPDATLTDYQPDSPIFSIPLPAGRTSTPRTATDRVSGHPDCAPAPQPESAPAAAPLASEPQRALSASATQSRLITELSQITEAVQLETVMSRVVSFLARFGCRAPMDTRGRDPVSVDQAARCVHYGPSDRIHEAKKLQRLYRKNRKTAVQRVLAGPNRHCDIDVGTVEEYFRQLSAARDGVGVWPDVLKQDAPTPESNERLCAPFGEREVLNCLKRRSNTSPGPDGVTYSDLRRADAGCRVLTALFNAVWRTQHVPASWGESNTILLYKKGNVDDIQNWRPISLGDTVPKLFAAVLSGRLKRWGVTNGRFSEAQKGFLQFEGCFEHNFALSEIVRDAKVRDGDLVVTWLDLASAFNSVPHSSVSRALEDHALPVRVRSVISSLYSGMRTSVRVARGTTSPIHVLSGVRQGCPLSPDIFNLTLEVVIRSLSGTGEGYTLEGRKFTSFFYADDGAIVADSPEGMRRLLEAAESAALALGIAFNPKKCATMHVKGGEVLPTEFVIGGAAMPALSVADAYEHLGIPTGYQVRQTPVRTVRELLRDATRIGDSLLAPWQKLDAIRTFLLPRLDFILQGSRVEKEYLTEADRHLRKLAKRCLNLPQRASAELICLPTSQGGGGILPMADVCDMLTVAHSYRLLYSGDAAVSSLADALLRRTASVRLRAEASGSDMARYLSGDMNMPRSSARSSFWAGVRSATMRLKSKIGLCWCWCPDREVFGLVCGGDGRFVWPERKNRVANLLRRELVECYARSLLAKKDQGKVFEVTRGNAVSNHFVRTGRNTRFCDWRFIHRARLNVLPLNATNRWQPGADKRCRRCGETLESLPHVLCHCGVHAAARQLRHRDIQKRLVSAAQCLGTISVNGSVNGTRGRAAALRPDIVVRDDVNRRIKIIDVCVPFENRKEALRLARRSKLDKYGPVADQLKAQGFAVTVEAFMVGALGAWGGSNEMVLSMLGIGKRYAGLMRRLMVSDTIRWSRDIYVEHVSGVRQYREETARE